MLICWCNSLLKFLLKECMMRVKEITLKRNVRWKRKIWKKIRFLHCCYKNSKIFFLQKVLSIVEITMPLPVHFFKQHRPSLGWNLWTGRHPCWSRTSRKTLCLDRLKRMDATEGRDCFPWCAGQAGTTAGS